jgi:Protein of unknown function (DUF2637)
MNSPHPAPGRNWGRRLVNLLVALVVVAVAGAVFVFSYAGVHAIALLGGMSTQLARYYPGVFDAVLVIACVAAAMLRDGRWWARLWAWVVIIAVLGAIGTTDVLHAMNYTLRHRVTEGIVAAAPVVAVLLAFSLLLTLLRQSRTQAPQLAMAAPPDIPALPAAVSVPPMALPAAPVAAPTEPLALVTDSAAVAPAAAAVAEPSPEPLPGDAPDLSQPDVPQEATAREARPATEPNEVIAPEAPADEPTPPTVPVPSLSAEPPTSPVPTVPARPQGIRYASNGSPAMAGESQADKRDTPPDEDYWDSEEAGQFAGLVYSSREDAAASDTDDGNDTEPDQSVARAASPELDDDAPPFATAPFATVPRLNRVRSMPTPPAAEDEDKDEDK